VAKLHKIGLALSGGGVRGAVHLGILKVFIKNKIFPDIIAGTSAGSIVGSLYAAGVDLEKFVEDFTKVNPVCLLDPTVSSVYLLLLFYYYWSKKTVVNWSFPRDSLKGKKLSSILKRYLTTKTLTN